MEIEREIERVKILAIDDSQDNLISLKALIKETFQEAITLTALNGTKGLELAASEDPDVILLDVIMPGMDGFEVCQKLKADKELCDIPVVFVTAIKGDKESRIKALECGAEAFLSKPIDEYELTAQIRAMVKIKAANIDKRLEKVHLTRLVEEQTQKLRKTHIATLNLLEDLKNENEARKISDYALRENNQRLNFHINNSPMATIEWNNDFIVTRWTGQAENMFGWNQSETIGKPIMNLHLTYEEDIPVEKTIDKLMDGSSRVIVTANRNYTKDGKIINCEWYNTVLLDPEGKMVSIFSQVLDITERTRTEAYKEMGSEVLRILNETGSLSDLLPRVLEVFKDRSGLDAVGIRLQDGDDFPYFVQDGFTKDFLLKENSLIERIADNGLCRDKDGNICLQGTCGLVITGKADLSLPYFTNGGSFWTNDLFQLLHIPSDKDPRFNPRNECIRLKYASMALIPIRDKDRIVGLIQFNGLRKGCFTANTVGVLEGIASYIGTALMRKQAEDEKIALEKQFQQTQKLESLGVLAGGIAHDFNNILTIILSHCYMAKDNYDSGITDKEHFQKIEAAGNRAADLCRQMLTYAGKSPMLQTQVNLWLLVDEIIKMLSSAIKKNVTFKLNLKRDVPEITGDTAQIQQIVMNLIINAAEAIGDKEGTINIFLTKTTILEGQADTDFMGNVISAGRYACLVVSDTGCGIDEENQKRIFEPFYTTKFTGRGLGMSAILGIIKSHGGALQLASTPGVGTTFTVYFYLSAVPKIAETAPQSSFLLLEKAKGRILLADDEEALRIIGSSLLNAMGFSTIIAANGFEALELYKLRSDDIDLIMLDLIMPKMGGLEAYHELRKIAPDVPIIICSGYGGESVEDVINNDIYARFMIKPYKPEEMRNVMVEMMNNQQMEGASI